jgi:Ulp1 family protease
MPKQARLSMMCDKLQIEGITVVTTLPSKISTKTITEQLQPGQWFSTAIIDWWLEYWCKLLPVTTFYSNPGISKRMQNNSLIQQKFVCTSADCYRSIASGARDELRLYDIFQCSELLMPVNMGNYHWVIAQIKFWMKTPAKVHIIWFDSCLNEADHLTHLKTFTKKDTVLKAWLTKRYNQRSVASSEGGAASGDAAADPLTFEIGNRRTRHNQNNGVDCGAWACMYASYLSLGLHPTDIREREDNGTLNINYVL